MREHFHTTRQSDNKKKSAWKSATALNTLCAMCAAHSTSSNNSAGAIHGRCICKVVQTHWHSAHCASREPLRYNEIYVLLESARNALNVRLDQMLLVIC